MRLVNNHGPEVVGRELELVALGLHVVRRVHPVAAISIG